jgi:hypothetical protein
MSSHLKINILNVLANLTDQLDLYLDWAATPGDDECPPEIVDGLCQAHETARELLEGLGYGQSRS